METTTRRLNGTDGLPPILETLHGTCTESQDSQLEVSVVFTNTSATLNALKTAVRLAEDLRGRVRLLVPQVVPYALPLETPPVSNGFTERRFLALASELQTDMSVDICLCRDKWEGILHELGPHSLVVLSSRHSWWPPGVVRLARLLRKNGHQVLITQSE